MTLVQLRHLISLAETGSFSRSAEALFLTQPALSRSIRSLEEEFGEPLFDRVGWRSEPTPFGREVIERARRLVADAAHLKESASRLAAGRTGSLKVGLGSGPGAILTVLVMRHFALHHPTTRLTLSRGATDRLEEALRERELDALVVDARSVPPSSALEVRPLGELRGAFLCRPGHPLAALGRALRFEELLPYPMATTPLSDEIGRVLVERYGPSAHLDERVNLRCDDVASLVGVAAQSDAIVLAVRRAAPGLVALELSPPLEATARFGLVTLAGRSRPPLLAVLESLIAELLTEAPDPAG
jgi:DNA-binding transcriptional LysR family regulator